MCFVSYTNQLFMQELAQQQKQQANILHHKTGY